ncbi:MAG: right-handed parallel beta-helix repeat-containing protein [Phycisphaerales bacterium]|nr:right-handed parallel beta-helix repeat-containing protein [Phycisphaerales bacterium]
MTSDQTFLIARRLVSVPRFLRTGSPLVVLLFVVLFTQPKAFAETVIQVSPDGPIASLQAAKDEVRRLKSEGAVSEGPIRVVFADGVYPISEKVVFTLADSGTKASPIIYEAAPDAKPLLHGGRELDGARTIENGLWVIAVPDANKHYFEQLWVNGRRATRAYEPDNDYFYMVDHVSEAVDPRTGEEMEFPFQRAFIAEQKDIAPLKDFSEEELTDVVFVPYHAWQTSRQRFAFIDWEKNMPIMTGGRFATLQNWGWGGRQRYRIVNYFKALDEPGEWYLSRTGTLYYHPRPGESIEDAAFTVPVTDRFIEMTGQIEDEGRSIEYIEYISFSGLSFQYARYDLPPEGYCDGLASFEIDAVIQIDAARNIRFEKCEVARIGTFAFWFHEACRDSIIQKCYLHDLGGGGVKIGPMLKIYSIIPEMRTSHITVDNCIIRGMGRVHIQSFAINIGLSGYNTITHNDVSDGFHSGISVDRNLGYHDPLAPKNVVEFNHIHHFGQGVLSDLGGVYAVGRSEGSSISNNRIHDIYSYDHYGRGGWGIYNDEGASDYIIRNNLVYNVKTGGYHLHYGKDNIIENNIFAESMDGQIQRSRIEDHNSFFFRHNIVYWNNGSPLFSHLYPATDPNVMFNSNLYWNASGPVDFNGLTLDEWRALPHGKGDGDMVADPFFVDVEAGNFQLKPDSPAREIGFKPFDYMKAGVYGDEDWINLANNYEYAELRLFPPPPPAPKE